MGAQVLNEPIFVGRKQEIAELNHLLNDAIDGRGTTAFISGEAGSGKTRLAKEFLDEARNKDFAVLAGWCLSNIGVPYFPFLEAFNSIAPINNETSNVFGARQQSMKTKLFAYNEMEQNRVLNPQVWKDQAFASITHELLQISTIRPTILFIDDIHWADSASLALLHYIARSIGSERLLVLATFRSEEINIETEGHPHQLAEALRLMGREGLFQGIKLTNLTPSDVNTIAESMLEGKLTAQFAHNLYQESQGNPLFVVESLRMIHSQGSLKQENGRWHPTDENMVLPEKVKDVILRRLGTIKPNQRRILEIASAIGEKFNPKLVSSAISETNMDILEALRSIAQSTLLVFREGEYYRFKHAKIQEMLYNELDPLLKREYHLRIAESLEKLEPPPPSDIAYHYANAGNSQKAAKYSLAAGKDALSRWSNTEAIKHFSYALDKSFILEDSEREIALEGLGDAYYASCMFEEATRIYDKLAESQTPIVKLRALRKEMDAVWFKERDPAPLVDLMKRAKPLAAIDRLENARIRWNRGRTNVWLGQEHLREGFVDHWEALRVFEEEYCIPDAAAVAWPVGICQIWLGENEAEGLGGLLRGIAMLDEIGDVHGELLAYRMGLIDWYIICGLFKESASSLSKMIELGEKIGDFDSLAFAWLRQGMYSNVGGNLEEAISCSLKALEYCKKADTKGTLCNVYSQLTQQYLLNDDINTANQYYNALNQLPEEIRKHPTNYPAVLWAQGFFLAAKKQFEAAEECIKQGNEVLHAVFPHGIGVNVWTKGEYSVFLNFVRRDEEAKELAQEINRIIEMAESNFKHVNLKASLMAFSHPQTNEVFEIRLDLVNVSRNEGKIVEVNNLLIPGLEITAPPPNCMVAGKSIQLKESKIAPFQARTIKLSAKIANAGVYALEPIIGYVDEAGTTCLSKAIPITIAVQPAPTSQNLMSAESDKIALATEPAKKVVRYLVKAFNEDCHCRMLPTEKSGWRTLMQIAAQANVTKHSLYGQMGHGGEILNELRRLRLVEAKFFSGERGRGGNVLKLRARPKTEN